MNITPGGFGESEFKQGFKQAQDQAITLLQQEIDGPYIEWYEIHRLEELQENIKKLTS